MCSTAIVPYAGLGLDRAADRRDDPAWIAAMRADRRARVWPLWRDQCLLAGDPPAPLAIPVGPDADQARLVLLGLHEGIPYFTVDLSDLPLAEALASVAADTAADIRSLFAGLSAVQAGTLAYARGLLYWDRHRLARGGGVRRSSPPFVLKRSFIPNGVGDSPPRIPGVPPVDVP